MEIGGTPIFAGEDKVAAAGAAAVADVAAAEARPRPGPLSYNDPRLRQPLE